MYENVFSINPSENVRLLFAFRCDGKNLSFSLVFCRFQLPKRTEHISHICIYNMLYTFCLLLNSINSNNAFEFLTWDLLHNLKSHTHLNSQLCCMYTFFLISFSCALSNESQKIRSKFFSIIAWQFFSMFC